MHTISIDLALNNLTYTLSYLMILQMNIIVRVLSLVSQRLYLNW